MGATYYAYALHIEIPVASETQKVVEGIHLYHLIGLVLVTLEHSKRMYAQLGYQGNLLVRIALDQIKDCRLLFSERFGLQHSAASPLDDETTFEFVVSSDRLNLD